MYVCMYVFNYNYCNSTANFCYLCLLLIFVIYVYSTADLSGNFPVHQYCKCAHWDVKEILGKQLVNGTWMYKLCWAQDDSHCNLHN